MEKSMDNHHHHSVLKGESFMNEGDTFYLKATVMVQ